MNIAPDEAKNDGLNDFEWDMAKLLERRIGQVVNDWASTTVLGGMEGASTLGIAQATLLHMAAMMFTDFACEPSEHTFRNDAADALAAANETKARRAAARAAMEARS